VKLPRSKLRGIKNGLYYFNEASFGELNPKRLNPKGLKFKMLKTSPWIAEQVEKKKVMNEHKKLLVFAQHFPPSIGGTPSTLRNLFSEFPSDRLAVISQGEPGAGEKCRSNYLQVRLRWPCKLFRKVDPAFLHIIPLVMFRSARLVKKSELHAIFVNFPGTPFLIAGWLLATWWHVDFYIYFLDVFKETRKHRLERWVAKRFEESICRSANKVFCVSNALRDFFAEKYKGVNVIWLPHCIDINENSLSHQKISVQPKWKRENETLIVYTGQIYESTVDPIHNLITSFEELIDMNPRLILSTPDPVYRLEYYGMRESDRVKIVFLKSSKDVQALQLEADILFNPVSFKFFDNIQIRTLFPLKTTEYLLAGRPMLIHGPLETSFIQYAQEKEFATVVYQADPKVLAKAIREIMRSPFSHVYEENRQRELKERDSHIVTGRLLSELEIF